MSRWSSGRPRGVLVAVAAGALLLAACSSGSASSTAASGSPSAAPGSSSAPSGESSAGASPTAAGTGGPRSSAGPSPLASVPARTRQTLPPVKPSTPVNVGPGARTVLVTSQSVTVAGRGPGELSGPGVALTLQVTNGTGRALDLRTVTVSASVTGQEASASDAGPSRPFAGTLAAGRTATGVYVFVLPAGARRPIAVEVSLAPQLPVARFTVP